MERGAGVKVPGAKEGDETTHRFNISSSATCLSGATKFFTVYSCTKGSRPRRLRARGWRERVKSGAAYLQEVEEVVDVGGSGMECRE